MKRKRVQPYRLLQIGFLVLFAVSFVQVVWWVTDQVLVMRRKAERELALLERDVEIAALLRDAGHSQRQILARFPHLETVADGAFRVSSSVEEERAAERFHHANQYGWEGLFFLVVLAGGMVVIYRALRQEAHLHRRQENFIASVSHEFRSPLASIRLAAETLTLRDPEPEGRRRLLKRMLSDVARLDGMVVNILDSTRFEENRYPLHPEALCLAQEVDHALSDMELLKQKAAITVEKDVDPHLWVRADRMALRTVLHNLTDNALKATAGRADATIRLLARLKDDEVEIDIIDNGVGFPPQEAPQLFEKFYRPGDELRRRTHGSGLGLYLVKRLVKLAGGNIHASSDGPGRGAHFRMKLPAAPGPLPESSREPVAESRSRVKADS